jgi:hypothetical protein
MSRFPQLLIVSGISVAALFLSSCHSAHVEVSVENRTGAPVRLLEVDYPSASFGSDQLPVGATMHYRIQVQGRGPVKVQYAAADGRQSQVEGPALAERQQGTLKIVLLPAGKAEFYPQVADAR